MLKRVYDAMPIGAKSIMASLYGYYLRYWRYGPETEQWVDTVLAREYWSSDAWEEWQQPRIEQLLERAATQVPYYRELWEGRRRLGDGRSWKRLENWPILKKDELRRNPEAFLADDRDRTPRFEVNTSGSSGTPVTTWRSKQVMKHWYALAEARWRRWYGVSRHDRWAMFGGKIVVPFQRERPPFWVWNQGLNQLYMSTFHLKPGTAAAYLEAMKARRVTYAYGYPSSMYTLARAALEQGLTGPELRVVISNAEPLLPHQAQAISEVFHCPVRNTYGLAEAVAAASECEEGALHLWPEVGVLEVLDDDEDERVPQGRDGRLVCTGLLNGDMPLVRYEVGDRGALEDEATCACGRGLPRLRHVVGRLSDNLVTTDGRRVFQLDHVFYRLHVKEAQIIQDAVGAVRVKLVPADDYGHRDVAAIEQRLRERIGPADVTVEPVDEIPREANGKFRAVICRV